MKYLHSTIQYSQQILKCISLGSESETSSSALIIHQNYAQLLTFEKDGASVKIKQQEMYPLSVPIMHVLTIGSHLAVITTTSQLMMLESKPPFKRVQSMFQLSSTKSPLNSPVSHCAASFTGDYLLATGYSGQAIVASFDSEDNPQIKTLTLPEGIIVHSVVATQTPEIFMMLVTVLKTHRKFVLHVDVAELKIYQSENVSTKARELYTVFNNKGYAKQFLFCDDMIIANIEKSQPLQIQISINCPVGAHFGTNIGELVYQLYDGSVHVYNLETKEAKKIGNLPFISIFCPLENDLLLCAEEHGSSYVMEVPLENGFESFSVDLRTYPQTHIYYMQTIACANFLDSNIIMSCGKGIHSSIVSLENSIKNRVEELTPLNKEMYVMGKGSEIARESTYPNSVLKLHAIKEGILLSSRTRSMSIFGNSDIELSSTLTTGIMNGNSVQVYSHGVKIIETGQKWFSDVPIVHAAITDNAIVVCDSNSTVSLLDTLLQIEESCVIPSVRGIVFCEELIAIATDGQNGTSFVTMYSEKLEPTDDVLQLSSTVHSMVYQNKTGTLFIATTNGTVRTYSFEAADFSQTGQKVLVGSIPATIIPFQNSAFIVSDKIYFFTDDELLLLKFDIDFVSIGCFLDDPDSIAVFGKDEKLYRVIINDAFNDINCIPTNVELMPRQIVVNNHLSYTTCKTGRGRNARSQIFATNSETKNTFTLDFPQGIEVVGMCKVDQTRLFVNVIDFTSKNIKTVLTLYETANDSFTEIVHNDIEAPIDRISIQHNGSIFVKYNEFLTKLDEELKLKEKVLIAPNITAMVSTNKFLWVASNTDVIKVYVLPPNNFSPKILTIADTLPRQVVSMVAVDDYSVAVGDSFGNITILRLPEGFIYGAPWSFVKSSELKAEVGILEKVASFCVGGTISSVFVSPKSKAIYYSTLLGQIGALIPIEKEDDYNIMQSVETQTEKACCDEFGLMVPRQITVGRASVIDGDMISMIRFLDPSTQIRIEKGLDLRKEWVMGIICSLKASAKF